MTETNVQKFYRILAEKTEAFGTKKEMMVQLGFEGAKLNSDRTRLNSDERAGRFPPVRLMIKLDSLFDREFLITCLREKMDCKTVNKRWAAVAQDYIDDNSKIGGRRVTAKRSDSVS
jgi:hypothetical protein|nr:MAG TPA: hypothetical protein [Caudoviricetes sp.]